MPTITSTGVGSGLDVGSIVSSLMSVEKQPLTQLQQRASQIQTRLSAFGTLKSQLSALGDVATRLADPQAWQALSAASSNSDAVSVTAGTGVAAGSHRIEVQQLAQAQSLASAAYAGSDAVVGTGSLTFTLGTTSGGTFTPKAGATPVTVTIGSGQQTLAGVRDAINAAGAGVTASIVGSGASSRLVLRGAEGAASSVQVTASDDDGNATDTAGLSALAFDPAAAAGSGRNLSQSQAARDALYTLDGLALTSSANTITDAIAGATIKLRQQTTAPVDIDVSVDTASVKRNVTDFANAYNALARLLTQNTVVDPGGKGNGPLQADATAEGLRNALRALARGAVSGLSAPADLSAAGLEMQRDGTLKVNDARVSKLAETPQALAALFTQAQAGEDAGSRGFALRFKAWAAGFTSDAGVLTARIDGLKARSDRNLKEQDAVQDRLSATEARLRKQYQALDTQISTLNAKMAQMRSSLGLSSSS